MRRLWLQILKLLKCLYAQLHRQPTSRRPKLSGKITRRNNSDCRLTAAAAAATVTSVDTSTWLMPWIVRHTLKMSTPVATPRCAYSSCSQHSTFALITSLSGRGREVLRSALPACLSVCMSARPHISKPSNPHDQTSWNFPCMLPVAVTRFFLSTVQYVMT